MTVPDTIVFDAEPLVAYFCDESGSDTVERHLNAVEQHADGYISTVTLTAIHDIIRAVDGQPRGDAAVELLEESEICRVDTERTWTAAAEFKFQHSPPLGDAFALGTAGCVDGTLLVGADDDYDGIDGVPITRFRDEPA